MEREGIKDNLASKAETDRRKHSEGMRTFLGLRKTKTIVKCKTLETTATLKSDDVSEVCHPSKSCLKLMSGDDEGVGLMGSKRVLKEKLDSPSKRFRGSSTYDLQAISGYQNKVVEDLDLENLPYIIHAHHQNRQRLIDGIRPRQNIDITCGTFRK